jgi:hypothetical protein
MFQAILESHRATIKQHSQSKKRIHSWLSA